MKKLFTLLLALVATTSLWARDFKSGDLYYNITSSSAPYTVEVTYERDYNDHNYSSLTTATIPETVNYNGTTYSVTSIGDYAFRYCRSLTSVTIPNSVTSIGDVAFHGCSSLITPVYNAHCFAYMPTSFKGAYVIPEGIKQIAGGAFEYCSFLTSVTIPNSVTSIGDAAFDWCSSLTSITIPNSVTSIGKGAFYGCSSLTSITIPNCVTSIGSRVFERCTSLATVTIGNNVTSIGDYAFRYCSSLNTLTCLAMTPPALGEDVFYRCDNPTLFVPCAALSDYQLHKQWGEFTNIECISSEEADTEDVIIESGTTTIQKIMRNGQLIILRDGVEYNAMGQEL